MQADQFIASRLRRVSQKHAFTRIIMRIAIISIALSVAVMIVTSALIRGFKMEISQKIFDFWGHIHITDVFISQTLEPAPIDYEQALVDTLLDIGGLEYRMPRNVWGQETGAFQDVKTRGGIKEANRYVQFAGILSANNDIEGLLLKGIGSDFNPKRFEQYLEEGEWLSLGDTIADRSLIISRTTADRMHISVGDQVVVYFIIEGRQIPRRLTVSGIYQTGLAEYDKKLAIADLRLLQQVQKWSPEQVSGIELLVDDLADLDVITSYIYQEVLPPELYTQSIRERSSAIFDWLDLQDINETIILVLMLIVCIVNMITALMILILERTNMIGVLKSMGSSNWTIRKIFIRQAAHILLIGLLVGNGLGLLICFIQKKFEIIKLNESDYYLDVAPIYLEILPIVLINVVTLVITVLFLIFPSYLISRISPSRAIRFS